MLNIPIILKLSSKSIILKRSNIPIVLKLSNMFIILKLLIISIVLKLPNISVILKLSNIPIILKLKAFKINPFNWSQVTRGPPTWAITYKKQSALRCITRTLHTVVDRSPRRRGVLTGARTRYGPGLSRVGGCTNPGSEPSTCRLGLYVNERDSGRFRSGQPNLAHEAVGSRSATYGTASIAAAAATTASSRYATTPRPERWAPKRRMPKNLPNMPQTHKTHNSNFPPLIPAIFRQ